MGNFPQQVYGKTGTAQYNSQPDYAWYACFVPGHRHHQADRRRRLPSRRAASATWAAAPVARQILSQWFFGKPGPFVAGTSHTL